jgi:hypothetical protein
MYQQAGDPNQQAGSQQGQADQAPPPAGDNVVDADYEVVDDKK